MQRALLFLFLVVAVPAAAWWWSHGFEPPGATAGRFDREVREILGAARPAGPATPSRPGDRPEQPRGPEDGEAEDGDVSGRGAGPGTAEPAPADEAADEPAAPPESPRERAERLFAEGRFAEAADAFRGIDPERRGYALLGAAFARAFPEDLPDRPYVVVRAEGGTEFEGFAESRGGLMRLVDAAGRSQSFPEDRVTIVRRFDSKAAVKDHVADLVLSEAAGGDLTGARVFALIQMACAAGVPEVLGPLLPRALALDEEDPYFLSSIRSRVKPAWQSELYRAFATCQAPQMIGDGGHEPTASAPPTSIGPRRFGGDEPVRDPAHAEPGTGIESEEVLALMREAAPLRKEAVKLANAILLAGVDRARLEDVNRAISLFDQAIAKYEQAVMIEDSDAIYAILRKCSKLNFTLRFMKQQLEAR